MRVFFWISGTFQRCWGKDQQRSQFQNYLPRWCEHGQSSFQRNQWTVKNVLTTKEVGRLLDKNIPFVCNVTNIYCQLEKCRKYFSQLRKHQRKSSWLGTGRRKYHSENPNYKSDGAGVLVALRPIWTAVLNDLNIFLCTSTTVDAYLRDILRALDIFPFSPQILWNVILYSCQLRSWPIISKIDIKHYHYKTSLRKR